MRLSFCGGCGVPIFSKKRRGRRSSRCPTCVAEAEGRELTPAESEYCILAETYLHAIDRMMSMKMDERWRSDLLEREKGYLARIKELERQYTNLKQRYADLQYRAARQGTGRVFGFAFGSSFGMQQLDDDKIGKLIRLCHPDRHGNSKVANEVTAWLLEQRRR